MRSAKHESQIERRINIFVLTVTVLIGCQAQTRQFKTWQWTWPKWPGTQTATQPATHPATTTKTKETSITQVAGNFFDVRILESTGSEQCIQNAWSYLDESSPLSKDWQLIHRNGLRCGIGQHSDWPTLKAQLEKCNTRVRGEFQIELGSTTPMTLLADKYRAERTIFYYDRDGRSHGMDFGASVLQFTMTTGGRMPEGRVRAIFTPRIVKRTANYERLMTPDTKRSEIELELENFSIIVDMGAREFALIGPDSKKTAATLVGSQLFLPWVQGQRKSIFILISPVPLEKNK